MMHFSFASPWVDPRNTYGNPLAMVQFWCFTLDEGELFSFGNDFVGPQEYNHGISAGFVRDSETGRWKVLYLIPQLMCENEQKVCKKIRYICLLFLSMKIKYYTLGLEVTKIISRKYNAPRRWWGVTHYRISKCAYRCWCFYQKFILE